MGMIRDYKLFGYTVNRAFINYILKVFIISFEKFFYNDQDYLS